MTQARAGVRRVALITTSPPLAAPWLRDADGRLRSLGIEVPLVVFVQPSMRLHHRLRDLRRVIRRQARMNRTWQAAQLVHHFAWRGLGGSRDGRRAAEALRVLHAGREVLRAESSNHPSAVAAIRDGDFALAVVLGADVLARATLEAIGVPILNVHLGDPSFVRGQPPVFWEILGGRDTIRLTLHELVARLDAGPVLLQRDVPIHWRRTLPDTLQATRDHAYEEVAALLGEGLEQILAGTTEPRSTAPGPLRTTPKLGQVLEARRICRARAARAVAR